MTAQEISQQHDSLTQQYDSLRQNCRDFIYAVCTSLGSLVEPTDDEQKYFRVPCEARLTPDNLTGVLTENDFPKVTGVRAYVAEGWIYVDIEDQDEPVDLDDVDIEDIIKIVKSLDKSEYKKVRPIALAKVLYALRQGETLTFSSAPYDIGLNYILTLVPLPPKVGISDMELYYLCYAPSCTNSAYIWWDLDGAPSHEASELMQFLESQPYPEDRPDADGMLYVRTEEWDEFCKAHEDLECEAGDVVDFIEED